MERQAITVNEFASAYGIGKTKAWELLHTPGFPAKRIGRRIIIPLDKLREWIAAQPSAVNP